jgi:hypothetical protein
MKHTKIILIFAVAFTFIISGSLEARAKWKGNWYLRGTNECKEINLDRKGRTTMGIYPKAMVEKKNGDLYLTVESMGKKYSYKMDELEKNTDYNLDLISVGPNLPVPSAHPAEGAYTGIFRMMVDCQTMLMGGVTEAPAK